MRAGHGFWMSAMSAAVTTGQHAGQRQRGRGVDAPHAGVGVGAPHHGGVRDARHLEVVDEGAAAGEQARVLAPRDRRADVAAFGRAGGGGHAAAPARESASSRRA
jgi:hypothetical protein